MQRVKLEGLKFGRLTVIHEAGSKRKRSLWYCMCQCGAGMVTTANSLMTGNAKSCGCLHSEKAAYRLRTHGESKGYGKTREYSSWTAMKQRCLNKNCPSYKHYGGRGITIFKEWINNYKAFLAYVGRCPKGYSLDRINVDGNYEPGSVRWASVAQQVRNKRSNRWLTLNNEAMVIVDWVKKLKLTRQALEHRIERGWSKERITEPLHKNKRTKI